MSLSPTTLAFMANVEYRVDDYLALGPMLQLGFSAETDMVVPTLLGRLILPDHFWKQALGASIETSILAGLGLAYREVQGFDLQDFVFQFGLNLDIVTSSGVTIGMATTFNFIDNSIDEFFPAIYGVLGYQF